MDTVKLKTLAVGDRFKLVGKEGERVVTEVGGNNGEGNYQCLLLGLGSSSNVMSGETDVVVTTKYS